MPSNLLLYLGTALPLALAYPPFRYGFFAYWAFIPFLLLLEDKSYGAALRWGYGIGMIVSVTTLAGNLWLSPPALITFALIQPVYFALFAAALPALRKLWPSGYLLLVPFVWTLIEYLRSFSEPAAPSLKLGYTQEYFMQLLQYAPSASVYAVSFWVVSLNVVLLAMWRVREHLLACLGLTALLLFLFVLPYLYTRYVQQRVREWQEQPVEVRREVEQERSVAFAPELVMMR